MIQDDHQNGGDSDRAEGEERRMNERRQHTFERRGVLRWDPQMKERRLKERRRSRHGLR